MKKFFLLLIIAFLAQGISAQPKLRRAEAKKAQKKSNAENVTLRSQISFPVEMKMNEDVVWRRDVYRKLDLTKEANAGLYYPVEPVDGKMNLFTYIFKLFLRGAIPAYEYRLDGNESFNEKSRVTPKSIIDNYHIYYEKTDKGIHIDESDIPSREVKAYYIKECSYFDQVSATFHTQVLALCPIMERADDFGDGATTYPLFWIKYSDLAPFLTKQTIMTSSINNAAVMSVDDYFTKNQYRGEIYKTNNMLGQTLAQYCNVDALDNAEKGVNALTAEQKRIEKEIADFEENMWGDKSRKDSLDSIAKLDKKELKRSLRKRNRRAGATVDKSTAKVKKAHKSSLGSSSSSSAARVTVRRERH